MEAISRKVLEIRVADTLSLMMVWIITWFLQLCFVLIVIDRLKDWWLVKLIAYNVIFIQPILTLIFFLLLGIGFIKVYDCEEIPIIRFVNKTNAENESKD